MIYRCTYTSEEQWEEFLSSIKEDASDLLKKRTLILETRWSGRSLRMKQRWMECPGMMLETLRRMGCG